MIFYKGNVILLGFLFVYLFIKSIYIYIDLLIISRYNINRFKEKLGDCVIMESTNGDKAKAGDNALKELLSFLKTLTNSSKKVFLRTNIAYGEENKDQSQFKSKAQIDFIGENLIWLIDVSSSYRSDRMKGKEFDVEHIKKILQENNKNSKAYFVLPDNAKKKDQKDLEKFESHIKKGDKVTNFDGAMLMSEFKNLLEKKLTEKLNQGQRSNILGNSGEQNLYSAFNDMNNLKIWNNPENKTLQSSTYKLFSTVLKKLTPSIGKLKSTVAYGSNKAAKDSISQDLRIVRTPDKKVHGKPKTDVIISLINYKNDNEIFKVSVKRPAANKGKVTVHEGNVEQLLKDLEMTMPSESRFNDSALFCQLSDALKDFQTKGSKTNMSESNREFLNKNLSDLNSWLIDYFIFGINNSFLNKNQQANVLLIYDPITGNSEVYTINKVKEKLLHGKMSTFNTPFGWTYPSKGSGRKIQIKSPIN